MKLYPFMMNFKEIDVTIKNGLQIIKFNRPHVKNAMSLTMYKEISQALDEGSKNNEVVITALTGAEDYYSSGADIKNSRREGDMKKLIKESSIGLNAFISAFIDFPKILIAVVNGPAIGIAVTTLGLCDVVYASDKATFTTPFSRLGLSAEGCSSYTFPRIMGTSMASEMLYFNRKINANEALNCGLVSQVFAHDVLNDQVWPKLEECAKYPALSMQYSKQLVRQWENKNLHEANDVECKRLEERWTSEDAMNAVKQFFKKHSKV